MNRRVFFAAIVMSFSYGIAQNLIKEEPNSETPSPLSFAEAGDTLDLVNVEPTPELPTLEENFNLLQQKESENLASNLDIGQTMPFPVDEEELVFDIPRGVGVVSEFPMLETQGDMQDSTTLSQGWEQ